MPPYSVLIFQDSDKFLGMEVLRYTALDVFTYFPPNIV